jgi:hypothetical protein
MSDLLKCLCSHLTGIPRDSDAFKVVYADFPRNSKELRERGKVPDPSFEGNWEAELEELCEMIDLCNSSPRRVNWRNLPRGSLQLLAKRLRKSQRQVRRYCELGLIPGAFRTPNGHWRIPLRDGTVREAKTAITKFSRREKRIRNSRKWKMFTGTHPNSYEGELPLTDPAPGEGEAPVPDKLALRIAARKSPHYSNLYPYLVYAARNEGFITAKGLAEKLGISRATLYRRVPNLRPILRAVLSGDTSAYMEYWSRR